MYRILHFKKLAIFCAVLCAVMLGGSLLCAFAPAITALSENNIALPIIMYHQVCDNRSIFGSYAIPPSLLESDLVYLKKAGYTLVKFSDVLNYLHGTDSLPKKPIILTFDDGERSFLTKVVPLLEKYNCPALVSPVGSLIELYTKNGDTNDRYAYLNKNDLKTLGENPLVEIGSHTYNLHSLGTRRGMGKLKGESNDTYLRLMKEDLTKNQNLIFECTGKRPYILAYPYGIRNSLLLDLVKSMGFTVTLTCAEKINYIHPGGTAYELGRFNRPYGISSEAFFSKLCS